jgi:hypothetical protein
MVKKKQNSSGGKAEAAGGNYETLVGAWYAHAVLLGTAAVLPLDLPADTRLVSFTSQSDAPVDDVNATTAEGGIIFVQAKRSVALSAAPTSAFASALDQFVRQHRECERRDPKHAWSRPLNPSRDRLVLATRSASSAKVMELLPRLLRGLRDRTDVRSLRQVATSQAELEVVNVVDTNLKRSWKQAYGRAPTLAQLDGLLRLIWVQELDLESGRRDRRAVLEHFRVNLLADPAQASAAFSELFKLAARLRAERSGADRPALLERLARAGIRLIALPDFRADVAALRTWTQKRLEPAAKFIRLLDDEPNSVIARTMWPCLQSAVETQSLLLVGEPGAGKSGLAYRLAAEVSIRGDDTVFLPVDYLNVDTFAGLRGELGITHELDEVLANWPGSRAGLLVVDALDAARKPETQTLLRDVIARILRNHGSRWKVVASVRKYDLRQGTEWARIFRGAPPCSDHYDAEFSSVSHISVARLSEPEIRQIAGTLPALLTLYDGASAKLRDLLQNIFNLHLLAELLRAGVEGVALRSIATQSELLDRYWHHRIRGEDRKHDAREAALTVIANTMIDAQTLRAQRADIRDKLDTEALVELEKQGILRADDAGGRPDDDILLFNHHVLFDYAVARLIFGRGRNPAQLVAVLRARRELVLMLSPSLTLAISDAWNSGGSRQTFWDLAFMLAEEAALPAVAQLAAPMVAVEQVTNIADLTPLFDALNAPPPRRGAAENIVQNLIGALFVRKASGLHLTGPGAGPWMTFAERLTASGSDRLILSARALIATAVEEL